MLVKIEILFELLFYTSTMSNEANPGLLPSQEQLFEMIRVNDYVKDNMVPIKEICIVSGLI